MHDSDDDYVKFDVIADGDRARFELRSETGDVVAQPETSEWLPYPEDDTYQLRLTKTGDTYTAAFRVTGGEWNTFDTPVTNTAVAGAPVGLFALGIFQDAPIYASFASFDITGETQPGGVTVQGFADPPNGPAPLQVQFSATGRDPDGGPLTYFWDFGDGQSTTGQQPVHTYRTPGEYEATVTAIDDEGEEAIDTVPVTVAPAVNQPPRVQAVARPTSGGAPLTVELAALGSDPEGEALTYEWDFGDGGGQFGAVVAHTYRQAGTFTATVTARDPGGASATDEIEITVEDPPANQPPTVRALADPQSGPAPLRVRLSSAPMDVEDGTDLLVVWDFGDGGQGGGEAIWHTYTTPGTYQAKVTVTDSRRRERDGHGADHGHRPGGARAGAGRRRGREREPRRRARHAAAEPRRRRAPRPALHGRLRDGLPRQLGPARGRPPARSRDEPDRGRRRAAARAAARPVGAPPAGRRALDPGEAGDHDPGRLGDARGAPDGGAAALVARIREQEQAGHRDDLASYGGEVAGGRQARRGAR